MTDGVTATIELNIKSAQSAAGDLGTARAPVTFDFIAQFEPGTDADSKANLQFADTRTLATATTEDLDLYGVLTTGLGAVISAAEIVTIAIKAATANTTNLSVGNDAAAFVGPFGATGVTVLKPGDMCCFVSKDGWPVTATTADILQVANASGAAASYDILLLGRTVAS